jgi:hypothetical protein
MPLCGPLSERLVNAFRTWIATGGARSASWGAAASHGARVPLHRSPTLGGRRVSQGERFRLRTLVGLAPCAGRLGCGTPRRVAREDHPALGSVTRPLRSQPADRSQCRPFPTNPQIGPYGNRGQFGVESRSTSARRREMPADGWDAARIRRLMRLSVRALVPMSGGQRPKAPPSMRMTSPMPISTTGSTM